MRIPTTRRAPHCVLLEWVSMMLILTMLAPVTQAAVSLKLSKRPADESLLIKVLRDGSSGTTKTASRLSQRRLGSLRSAARDNDDEPQGIILGPSWSEGSPTASVDSARRRLDSRQDAEGDSAATGNRDVHIDFAGKDVDSHPSDVASGASGQATSDTEVPASSATGISKAMSQGRLDIDPSITPSAQSSPANSASSASAPAILGVSGQPSQATQVNTLGGSSQSIVSSAANSPGSGSSTPTTTYASRSSLAASSSATSAALAPSASSSGLSLPGTWVQGQEWTVEVNVGDTATSAQTISVIMDTGSADFWAPAFSCGSTCTGMTPAFHVAASCEWQQRAYGSAGVKGCFTNGSLTIGSYTLNNYQALAAIEVLGIDPWMNGIWGLGMKALALDGHLTVLDALYQRGMIEQPLAGFYLTRDEDKADSELVIGNPSKLENYASIVNTAKSVSLPNTATGTLGAYYNAALDAVKVGDRVISGSSGVRALFDTGTTNIFAPDTTLKYIYASFTDSHKWTKWGSNYVVPCNYTQNDVDIVLSFTFGGIDFGMQWRDLRGPPADPASKYCYGTMYPGQPGLEDKWVLGGRFLANVFHTVNSQTGEVTLYGLN